MPDQVNALYLSEEDDGDNFLSMYNGVRSGFAGLVSSPSLLLGVLVRPLDERRCEVRA
jgi:hypothetical protein